MRRPLFVLAALFALAVLAGSAHAARPLNTGIIDPGAFSGPQSDRSFARARTTGSSVVRMLMPWSTIAPTRPTDPSDPDDPDYHWGALDDRIEAAVDHDLAPLIYISGAPGWARGAAVDLPGTWPSPARLGDFAKAAARRYSGTFIPVGRTTPLPRVRYWQAWNEPNTAAELTPQRRNGKPASPLHYRKMLNEFADAVHGARTGNLVVAGTLAPFGHDSSDIQVVAPLRFMSDVLCVSIKAPYRKTCSTRVHLDVWAHNPYTNGDPSWHAYSPADVSIGDLPEMRAVLLAAKRRGTLASPRTPELWVTEFSWDTSPPDPKGVPTALHARWVSEALYRMWQAGVTTAIWWRLEDDPLRRTPYQSGFYTAAGKVKLSREAFRFPFVAYREARGVAVWGRTPFGKSGTVAVEARSGSRWVSVARLRADRYGIFSKRIAPSGAASATTALRARLVSGAESSVPFSLTVPPRRRTTPFGCGGNIPC